MGSLCCLARGLAPPAAARTTAPLRYAVVSKEFYRGNHLQHRAQPKKLSTGGVGTDGEFFGLCYGDGKKEEEAPLPGIWGRNTGTVGVGAGSSINNSVMEYGEGEVEGGIAGMGGRD